MPPLHETPSWAVVVEFEAARVYESRRLKAHDLQLELDDEELCGQLLALVQKRDATSIGVAVIAVMDALLDRLADREIEAGLPFPEGAEAARIALLARSVKLAQGVSA